MGALSKTDNVKRNPVKIVGSDTIFHRSADVRRGKLAF
jgi:hypothetical protein